MLTYEQWESSVSREIRSDSVWKIKAYRLALFLADLAWEDSTVMCKDRRSRAIADQLLRAVGSISANIAEGYSRSGGRDRAHFYEYALGSSREGRDWYFKVKHALGEGVAQDRIQRLTEIVRLLLTMVPDQRSASSARITKAST
jgi:four helix bundle protein